MANTKHTPGPWGINKYGGIGAGEFFINPVIIDSNGFAHDWDALSRERYDADVRLIAAAPDMLAALEAIAGDCERIFDGNCFQAGYRIDAEYFTDRVCAPCVARAAIAKAKGE